MTSRDINKQVHKVCICNPKYDNNQSVQNNLALTPKDIKALTERGMAVSAQQLAVVNDAESLGQVPLEDMRGMDINQAWELEQRSRTILSKSYKTLKNKL